MATNMSSEHLPCPVLVRAFIRPHDELIDAAVGNASRCLTQGNLCRVHRSVAPRLSPDDEVDCYAEAIAGNYSNGIDVRCFNSQGAIACCGHGLLSVAAVYRADGGEQEIGLRMGGSEVSASFEGELCWLQLTSINCRPVAVPSWATKLSDLSSADGDPRPVAAAHAGDDNDYLVLQWADNINLRDLPAKTDVIKTQTQRAVIYTSRQKHSDRFAISLRYFAPQYGTDEDAATGSAMRVLADYWSSQSRLLIAHQCSPAADGFLYSKLLPSQGDCHESVLVGGYCKIET